jgi:hypothetical protein
MDAGILTKIRNSIAVDIWDELNCLDSQSHLCYLTYWQTDGGQSDFSVYMKFSKMMKKLNADHSDRLKQKMLMNLEGGPITEMANRNHYCYKSMTAVLYRNYKCFCTKDLARMLHEEVWNSFQKLTSALDQSAL